MKLFEGKRERPEPSGGRGAEQPVAQH
jgi:hypothetical protein